MGASRVVGEIIIDHMIDHMIDRDQEIYNSTILPFYLSTFLLFYLTDVSCILRIHNVGTGKGTTVSCCSYANKRRLLPSYQNLDLFVGS